MPSRREQENRHPATNKKQCVEMGRLNGWDLKKVEPSGDSMLKVTCIFYGAQTNFADQDPYADLDLGDDDE